MARHAHRVCRGFLRRHPCVFIGLSSFVWFLGLLAATEALLRIAAPPGDEATHDHMLIGGRARVASEIRLIENPPFRTDTHGIWTATPGYPGINEDGYRSLPFDAPDDGRPSILLLGDSFTYGMSADPISLSFADQVRQAGYRVHNLGIPGTSPVQYRAQAALYVPQLKPDIVAVALYPGDDFNADPPIRPGLERGYVTNIGILGACDFNGAPVTFDDAVAEYLNFHGNGVRAWATRALLGSALAQTAIALLRPGNNLSNYDAGLRNLEEIARIAKENGAEFCLFVLPLREAFQAPALDTGRLKVLLAGLEPLFPEPFEDSLYAAMPDPHFNNEGHTRFAQFVLANLPGGTRPTPEVSPGAPSVAADGKISFQEVVEQLQLTKPQADRAKEIINAFQDKLAAHYFVPPAPGVLSPGEYFAQQIEANGGVPAPSVVDEFVRYAARLRPPNQDQDYVTLAGEMMQTALRQLAAMLVGDENRIFIVSGLKLTDIDTGYDPFGDRIAALLNVPGTAAQQAPLSWEEFQRTLRVDGEAAAEIKAIINAHKDRVADLLVRKPADGEISPADRLASLLHQPAGHDVAKEMDAFLAREIDPVSGTTFQSAMESIEEDCLLALQTRLSPEANAALRALRLSTPTKIETGHDPLGRYVGERIAALRQGGAAPPTEATINTLAALQQRLDLTPQQMEKITALINATKDRHAAWVTRKPASGGLAPVEVLARGLAAGSPDALAQFSAYAAAELEPESGKPYTALLAASEPAARRELFALLEPRQQEIFVGLTLAPLADFPTGHDPFGEALRQAVEIATD